MLKHVNKIAITRGTHGNELTGVYPLNVEYAIVSRRSKEIKYYTELTTSKGFL